jgi:hypothetical protein
MLAFVFPFPTCNKLHLHPRALPGFFLVGNKEFGSLLIADFTVLPTGLHQIKKYSSKGSKYQVKKEPTEWGNCFHPII